MIKTLYAIAVLTFLSPAIPTFAVEDEKKPTEKITFDDHIQPLLRQRCSSCHSPNKKSGDLDVTTYTALMQGGASGAVIEAGDVDFSYLYSLVNHDEQPYMPPGDQKIPENEIELLAAWINGGALENKGSKAVVKKKVDLALAENPTARPEVVPMPARTVLEPLVSPKRSPDANTIATSPWAPLVAVGAQKQVLIYNTTNLQLLGVIPYDGQVNSLRFSRNGQLLAIGGGKSALKGNVLVWNLVEGEPVTTVGDELDAVLACDISPDQSMVALGGPQRVVRVYSTSSGELLYEIVKHTEWITALEFSPDGALLVTGDRNGGLHTWEAMTGREYMTLKGHTKAITSVSWRSDSNLIASGSEDTTIRLWELNGGKQIKSWGGHGGGTLSIEFARDGRIASCGRDKVCKIWDQQGKQLKAFAALPDIATEVSYCDETNRAIGGSFGGKVSVWKFDDGALAGDLNTAIPTLEQRVASSQTKLASDEQQLAAKKQGFDKAKVDFDAITKQLNEFRAARASIDSQMQQLTQKINNSNTEATAATQARDQLAAQLKQANETLPPLEASIANLADASSKSPDDAKLKESLGGLQTQASELKNRIAQLQTQTDQANSKLKEITQVLTESNSQMQVAQTELGEMDKKINVATQQEAPLKTAFDTAQAELNQVQQTRDASASQLAHWNQEIQFKNQLATLTNDLQSIQEAESGQLADLAEKKKQLAEAQSIVDQAQTALNSTQQKAADVQTQIRAIKSNSK